MVRLSPQSPAALELGRRKRRKTAIRLTPLIDVVFILLVFFMLASSFLDWRSVALKSPAIGGTGTPITGTILIDLAPQGLRLGGVAMSDAAAYGRLAALTADDPDRRILLRPGHGVDMQRTLSALDRISAAGGRNVDLVNPPGSGHGGQP